MGWGDPKKNNSEEISVIEKPLPVEQPIVPAVEEDTDTFTSATMIPSADDDIEVAEPATLDSQLGSTVLFLVLIEPKDHGMNGLHHYSL